MPDRTRKRPADANRRAWEIVQEATGEKPKAGEDDTAAIIVAAIKAGKDPAAVLLGRKGGLKGGKARAAALTPKRRREIAQKAARARWAASVKRDAAE
jgi:hypothetical protein